MQFFTLDQDNVIDGYVITAVTTYRYALDNFAPLIGRLDIQRDPLKTKFYSRLEQDIVKGCVMPPITIALIRPSRTKFTTEKQAFDYVTKNISNGFVLDGIQRLNTLTRSAGHKGFSDQRPLHVSFVIAKSRDRLLYRMITLNNGQKPMSARHQIDVLADAFFDFEDLKIDLVAEKGGGRASGPVAFKKADFVKGYMAYLSNSVSIDNQKIIEEKMDELIANRIIDSDIAVRETEFSDVMELVATLSKKSEKLNAWLHTQNNFIGFCVGIRSSLPSLQKSSIKKIENAVDNFDSAFSSVNVSKINLGKARRELVSKFVESFEETSRLDEFSLLDKISEWI
ncbi:hypothetical protein [Herbaspirillum seropedicae]|uniref:hypothetical protein n=1 Tax=Herbaspirillum seropedicae TaxID=964 RepID=UPI003D96DEC9